MKAAERLRSHGLVHMPALPEAQCEALMAELCATWRGVGEPTPYSEVDQSLGEQIHISPVGFTLRGVLEVLPSSRELLLFPPLLEALEDIFGDAFALELGAAVLSDGSRPFFFWHHHIGGIDGEAQRRRGSYPVYEEIERVACTFYLSPVDAAHGQMHYLPRALQEPSGPAGEIHELHWPRAQELAAPAGTLVMLDQSTWHCVTPTRWSRKTTLPGVSCTTC